MTNSTQIQIGSTIKSFDFPGIVDDCYVVGVVTSISENGLMTCETISQTFDGQPVSNFALTFRTMVAELHTVTQDPTASSKAPAAKLLELFQSDAAVAWSIEHDCSQNMAMCLRAYGFSYDRDSVDGAMSLLRATRDYNRG